MPWMVTVGPHTTNQPLYICEKMDRIYFSSQGCLETKIISLSFPYSMPETTSMEIATISTSETPLTRPSELPYPATLKNILKLENYLPDKFSKTTFNRASPFPAMNSLPAHKPNAKPVAQHTLIPIAIHWKKIIKESLDYNVQQGIITPVPIGTSVEWYNPMIVTSKKDGAPRKTVDLQHLNAQCLCKTHHTQSPFQAASSIPPNTWKTVLDAVDG